MPKEHRKEKEEMSDIISFFPSHMYDPYPSQIKVLKWLEKYWNTYDVFVINSPVGSGKTALAVTTAEWLKSKGISTGYLTPTRILQKQIRDDFPNYPILMGMTSYICKELNDPEITCHDMSLVHGGGNNRRIYCDDCEYAEARMRCKEEHIAVCNYHTYSANRIIKDVVIVDEAHNVPAFMLSRSSLFLWQSKEFWPNSIRTLGDVAIWLEDHIDKLKLEARRYKSDVRKSARLYSRASKLAEALGSIVHNQADYYFNIERGTYRGNDDLRIRVEPLTTSRFKSPLWSYKETKKVVLMSATISEYDILEMGLTGKRVGVFETSSNIPAEQRKFIVNKSVNMGYVNKNAATELAEVVQMYADRHIDEKGMVHVTYRVASAIKKHLAKDKRFIWHNRDNKMKQYDKFRKSQSPVIFVASGLSEGIDLINDAGRWQVIGGIPFANTQDGWVKAKKKLQPKWQMQEVAKIIQQATGRICRNPSDVGTTYMVDSRFPRSFYQNINAFHKWFREAIYWSDPYV